MSKIRINSVEMTKQETHHAQREGGKVVHQEESLFGKAHACLGRHDAKPRDKLVDTLNNCGSYGRQQDEPAQDEECVLGTLDVLPIALGIG